MLGHIVIIVCVIIPCWSRLSEEQHQPPENPCNNLHCYHKFQEECPPPEATCRCKLDERCRKAVLCCDVDEFRLTESLACANAQISRGEIDAIHIRNATIETLNLTEYITWRRLTSMAITDGRISSIVGEFGKIASTACLNLSSNGISKFEERSLVNLFNLSDLDLSHNNLSDVPRFKKKGNVNLDISANTPMLCINVFEAMKRPELQFNSQDETTCKTTTQTFSWLNSTERLPFSQLDRLHVLRSECNPNCTCTQYRIDLITGETAKITVMVNCSGQHFTELPKNLPPNTIALNISNNNITSLEVIGEDPSYMSLRELYAENNQITSMLPLEGTKLITSFNVIDLRNNKLKQIPIYFLTNVFDRNSNNRYLKLGKNKLTCDCNTAKVLKLWLMTKHKDLSDYEEIECENMKERVVDLDPTKMCRSQQDWTDYIYYVIAAEIFLLVLLFTKVSYDYWVFKTAGYLPWPASKMPKLPCDWLCE